MNATKEVFSAYTFAYELASNRKDEYVTVEHLFYAIIEESQDVVDLLSDLGAHITRLKRNILKYLDENIEKNNGKDISSSDSFEKCFIMAEQIALLTKRKIVGIEHVLTAMLSMNQTYVVYYLSKEGVSIEEFLFQFTEGDFDPNEIRKSSSDPGVWNGDDFINDLGLNDFDDESDFEGKLGQDDKNDKFLNKYSTNLNEVVKKDQYDKMIGREDVLDRTIQILCRKTKNNPIHVGESGVGKTAITLGLAERINEGNVPKKLKNSTIYSLDIGSLLAGTKYRGDFEERMQKVLEVIKTKMNPIVYIDEIHTIVGAGSLGEGALDASNLLKPYLNEGSIRFVGATTYDEYKKHFEKDKALARRFGRIEIKETTRKETLEILERIKENYEKFHQVTYTKEALEQAVNLSDKYINDRFLPDKAIDIMDEAGAYISMKSHSKKVITEHVIEEIISKTCGIPKQTVKATEINLLKNLDETMKKSIFGQDVAISEVVRCIKLSRAGLKDEDKPVASMLFVGPTGVGKTEIAKCLAKNLGVDLVRFDMSEYSEKHAASKLIGAPPGYVGYDEGGLLTDLIRKKPHSVLLLDEIEKAHPDILNVLLQIMDYASLTDNQGRKSDFRNVIIIMTSNAGARNIGKSLIGFNDREIQNDAIFEAVKKVFTPEFRNRLDKVIAFNHVNHDMAYDITKKELKAFKLKLKSKKVDISYTEKLIQYVATKGVSREFGAREIIRVIETEIKPLLVEEILFGKLKDGGTCKVDIMKNGSIEVKYLKQIL